MTSAARGLGLLGLALITAAVVTGGSAIAPERSDAQPGSMHNCPTAGKWSIAVWGGASGTEAADGLAACGGGSVAAAYSLDPQTGAWSRWFAGKPDVSNLPSLGDMQGLLVLGAAGPVVTPTATTTPTPVATPTPTSTPAAGTPEPGTYTGMTSQGRAIQLEVAEGSMAISRIEFDYKGTCGQDCECQGHLKTTFPIPTPITDNAFSYSVSYYDISGAFQSATTASGDLHVHTTGPGQMLCDSGPTTWTASVH